MDERVRDALRRNALLSQVLAEGYRPSIDAALRAELARHRRRPYVWAAAAAGALLAAWLFRPTPAPVVVPAPPAPLLEVVRTASPALEIVPTGAPVFDTVRTTVVAYEVVGDEELLRSNRVVAIVGHPGGPKRVIVAP